jgi:hypothetical protein
MFSNLFLSELLQSVLCRHADPVSPDDDRLRPRVETELQIEEGYVEAVFGQFGDNIAGIEEITGGAKIRDNNNDKLRRIL